MGLIVVQSSPLFILTTLTFRSVVVVVTLILEFLRNLQNLLCRRNKKFGEHTGPVVVERTVEILASHALVAQITQG